MKPMRSISSASVEDQGGQAVEVEGLSLQVVHDPARGADDDVGAAGELLQLDAVAWPP